MLLMNWKINLMIKILKWIYNDEFVFVISFNLAKSTIFDSFGKVDHPVFDQPFF